MTCTGQQEGIGAEPDLLILARAGEMKETGCMVCELPKSLMRLEMRWGLEEERKVTRKLLCREQRLKLKIHSHFLINYHLVTN